MLRGCYEETAAAVKLTEATYLEHRSPVSSAARHQYLVEVNEDDEPGTEHHPVQTVVERRQLREIMHVRLLLTDSKTPATIIS